MGEGEHHFKQFNSPSRGREKISALSFAQVKWSCLKAIFQKLRTCDWHKSQSSMQRMDLVKFQTVFWRFSIRIQRVAYGGCGWRYLFSLLYNVLHLTQPFVGTSLYNIILFSHAPHPTCCSFRVMELQRNRTFQPLKSKSTTLWSFCLNFCFVVLAKTETLTQYKWRFMLWNLI